MMMINIGVKIEKKEEKGWCFYRHSSVNKHSTFYSISGNGTRRREKEKRGRRRKRCHTKLCILSVFFVFFVGISFLLLFLPYQK
jgi:cell division septal protein FtsQ